MRNNPHLPTKQGGEMKETFWAGLIVVMFFVLLMNLLAFYKAENRIENLETSQPSALFLKLKIIEGRRNILTAYKDLKEQVEEDHSHRGIYGGIAR